jgi:GxxExxY protein
MQRDNAMDRKDAETQRINELSNKVIGFLIEIHRALGPGLLESAYEECLCFELSHAGIPFKKQVSLPVVYKGIRLDCGYRIDILVDDCLILELKAVEKILPIHDAQLLTYLKLSGKRLGLLVNFNVPVVKDGIKRIANGL